jgi:adenylate kinase family enzyme
MAKHSATDTFDAQREKIEEIIQKLAAQFDLDEDDLETIKEWGIALLVTGVSVYIVYQLFQRMFGSRDEKDYREEIEEEISDYADRTSAFIEMLKKQAVLFAISLARRQIMRLFR